VIQAKQTERDGKKEENDRLIAVAANSRRHGEIKSIDDLSPELVDEIEHFFVSYNEIKGKRFEPKGRKGAVAAKHLVEKGTTLR